MAHFCIKKAIPTSGKNINSRLAYFYAYNADLHGKYASLTHCSHAWCVVFQKVCIHYTFNAATLLYLINCTVLMFVRGACLDSNPRHGGYTERFLDPSETHFPLSLRNAANMIHIPFFYLDTL